jgi:hypothetical protein
LLASYICLSASSTTFRERRREYVGFVVVGDESAFFRTGFTIR